jgi:hypothetical protein
MMEAVSTSETSVNFYEAAMRNTQKAINHVHIRCRENLKSLLKARVLSRQLPAYLRVLYRGQSCD